VSNPKEIRAAELERFGQEWAAAELRGDTTFFEETLADDFVGIGPYGFMLSKAEWIERHTTGKLKYESFALDEVRVRLYGDTAVLTGRETAEGRYEDGDTKHDIREKFRVTLVLVKRQEDWLLAGVHLSFIAGGKEEAAS